MLHEQYKKMNMTALELLENLNQKENLGLDINEKNDDKKESPYPVVELNKRQLYAIEKYEVRPNQVGQIIDEIKKFPKRTYLVASRYITPNAKNLLNEARVNYIDSGGNISLILGRSVIKIEGRYVKPPSENYKNRAFTKVGAKLIYVLLQNPDLINATYRSLSELSTCSLGSISKIIDHLKQEHFVIKLPDKKLKLARTDQLLEYWIQALRNQLLPSILVGRYSFIENWKTVNLQKEQTNTLWGGEPAASLLSHNLQPENQSLFTSLEAREIQKKLKLTPNPAGALFIYKKFWNGNHQIDQRALANPLLIYAQLIASGDSRNIEVATEIKKTFLNEFI